jgi:hypothetical protein
LHIDVKYPRKINSFKTIKLFNWLNRNTIISFVCTKSTVGNPEGCFSGVYAYGNYPKDCACV